RERAWAVSSSPIPVMPSSIDDFPLDFLVQIFCKLDHDELRPLRCVSKSFNHAAIVAQQMHFDFSTPAPKKSMAFSRHTDASPGGPSWKLEVRKPKTAKLSEGESRRIAVVLFPATDSDRRLTTRPACRHCSVAPGSLHLANAHA
ncbi:unnamed protein product, partial [Musa acuminata subsp. burmannicoides]